MDVDPVVYVHTGATAAITRARREMLGQLRRAEAFSPDRALELELKRGLEQRVLQRMLRREIIRPGARGGYWLDRNRLEEWKRQQLLIAIGMLIVTFGVIACVLIYAPGRHHHPRVTD